MSHNEDVPICVPVDGYSADADGATVPAAEAGSGRPRKDAPPRTHPGRRHHRVILGIAGFVLLMSLLLEVVPEGRVAFCGLEAYPLPHTCSMRLMFGHGCPACGMTRGFIHLAHGRLQESLAVHRLAWLFFAALLVQFPYRLTALLGENPAPLGRRWPALCGWVLIALLLINWIAGLVVA